MFVIVPLFFLPPTLPMPPTPQIHCFLPIVIIIAVYAYIYMPINTNYCFYLVPLVLYFYGADQLGLDHPDTDQFFSL